MTAWPRWRLAMLLPWRGVIEHHIGSGGETEDGLVFVTAAGLAVNGTMLTKRFQRLLAAAGLPKMRLHDLRHGAASLLAAVGTHPSVAQAILGHASARTTMDLYTHTTADQQREAVERVGKAMERPKKVSRTP